MFQNDMFQKYLKFLIKLCVSFLLLAYLWFKSDIGQLKEAVLDVRLLPFFISYFIRLVASFPLALRLRALMEPTAMKFSLPRLIQVEFISQFYGLFLPSAIGPAVVRWFKVTRNRFGRRIFFVITVLERAMLTLTLMLSVGIPLLLTADERVHLVRSSLLPVILVIIIGCFLFFSCFLHLGAYRKMSRAMQWLQLKFKTEFIQKVLNVYKDCGVYIERRQIIIKAFVFHLMYQGLTFVQLYFLFVALQVDLHVMTIIWVSMLVLLLMNIPISIGGIGVRESGFAWLLALYGIEPERGALLGVLLSCQLFIHVGIGAVMNVLESKHPVQGDSV
jgi:uncharacterized protein (TIRG00374 family)